MSQALDNSKAKRPRAREGGVGRLVVLGVYDSDPQSGGEIGEEAGLEGGGDEVRLIR